MGLLPCSAHKHLQTTETSDKNEVKQQSLGWRNKDRHKTCNNDKGGERGIVLTPSFFLCRLCFLTFTSLSLRLVLLFLSSISPALYSIPFGVLRFPSGYYLPVGTSLIGEALLCFTTWLRGPPSPPHAQPISRWKLPFFCLGLRLDILGTQGFVA